MSRFVTLVIVGTLTLALASAAAHGHKDKAARPPDRTTGKPFKSGTNNGQPSKPHPLPPKPKKGKGNLGNKGTKAVKGGPAQKKLTPKHRKRLMTMLANKDLSAGEKAAVGKLLSGEPLSSDERDRLANLAASDRADLTADDREAISQGLSDDLSAKMVAQNRRVLRVRNSTDQKLTVYVQYQTLTSADRWAWYPSDPTTDRKAMVFRLDPGSVTYLTNARWRINASRIRIWARSESGGRWDQYRDRDLWLVSELNDSGEHAYYAAQMDTYTFTFRP